MKESENLNKVELIGVTSQSDIASDLKRLVAALKKQGFNVTPAKENSLLRTPLDGETLTKNTAVSQREFDPNREETEEDGIRAERLRRLKVRQMSKGRQGQTKT